MAAILRNPRRRWSSVRGVAMAALVVVWSVSHIRTYATPGRRDAPPSAGCLRSDQEQFAGTGIPLGRLLLAGETTLHRRGRQHCSSLGVGLGRDDTRRLGIAPTSRPVAGTSEPCRTSHQYGRQADRAHRLCAPRGCVGRDHDRHLQGSRPRPQRGAGDDSTRPAPAIAALSPRLGHGIGGCGGRLRPACSPRRASRVDDHHAAVDRGDCTQ